MGKTATNLSIVLGLITITFAGYYLYTQKSSTVLNFDTDEQVMQNALTRTSLFIGHRKKLDKIALDLSIMEDKRFTTLRSFTAPIDDRLIGRPNPFDDTFIIAPDNSTVTN